MLTTRRRPKGEQDAARLPATVAREMELTAARRARLHARRNDLAELRDLDAELHALEGRQCARRDR